jgi:enoyl-CoA hydratase
MTVLVDTLRPGVTRITLDRPEALNAMTAELIADLGAALSAVTDACRIVVLTGAGRGFCAGLDLNGYRPEPDDEVEVEDILRTQREIAGVMQAIRRLPQPVIAVVNGPAAGGGLGLVCACDVRIGTEGARLGASFISAGYSGCDMGVSWLLPRLVGAGRAHELMLTGRLIDAAEALGMGLLSAVVPARYMSTYLDRLLEGLLAAPPLSLSLTKQGMWLSLEVSSFDHAIEFENRQQVITAMTTSQRRHMDLLRERMSHGKS